MLGKLLIWLLLAAGMLAWYINSRPAPFRVARSLAMAAPAEAIFPLVNSLREWQAWSPWDKFDANMQRTYSGPPEGVGAVYGWSGNAQMGAGSATIVASEPHRRIAICLRFVRPLKGENDVEFTFQPRGSETIVTWSMKGEYNFVTKAIGLIANMDKMSGDQFSDGLMNLKRLVERAAV